MKATHPIGERGMIERIKLCDIFSAHRITPYVTGIYAYL